MNQPIAIPATLSEPPILEVVNLSVTIPVTGGEVRAVDGASFSVGRERVAIIGESGSGKTQTGRAILRMNPPSARVTADRLTFRGHDLLRMTDRGMRAFRGRDVTMILQDPRYSLHPLMRVGDQIAEAARVCGSVSRGEARQRAMDMLEQVQIGDAARAYELYPHEVSGGMGQRIMIAMMLMSDPQLIIADEPTSALDVVVRSQILGLIDDLIERRGIGLLFISHDLNLVRSFCDRIIVMYQGRIVEQLLARELQSAAHPYTQALLAAIPHPHERRNRLPVLSRDPSWVQAAR